MDDNPYASPQTILELPHAPANGRGLLWTLFAFRGRIPRRTYWMATLGVMIAGSGALYFSLPHTAPHVGDNRVLTFKIGLAILLWPLLAIEAKRFHDRGKSAVWLLLRLVPIAGPLWIFIEAGCMRGTLGPNRYGPDPT